jgi:RNA polymerase sigma-54 factor
MKPGLQIQMGQQLTMTPQLQQAIRLLQLSTVELRQEIREALETNPLLELEEDFSESESLDAAGDIETGLEEDIPQELDMDSDWEDWVDDTGAPAGSSDFADDPGDRAAPGTLHDHLLWQLNLTPFSPLDRAIAHAILESLDERGYLTADTADIADAARAMLGMDAPEGFPEEDEILAVLHRLQRFDPPGVAARDLRECLRLQLEQLPGEEPLRQSALGLVQNGLELLEHRDYRGLRRALGLGEQELVDALTLIRSLNPFPGEALQPAADDYVIPDVIVNRRDNRWRAELNPEALPRLGLNHYYASLAGQARSGEEASYLRGRLQEARWLLKSLQSRNETLLRVTSCIVEVQQDFFTYGEEAMKPLVLAEVAEAVEMHESTISRVTNQKFMLTPRGLFELKYFFSSHVSTEAGGECSSTAIRAIIRKLIAAEDSRKPLSDNKLATLLGEQGIKVARRTVAKYREAMKIPASSERKRLY